ncbi:MAG: hypothetical protein V4599_02640 [Verrucomicrobiota bacterium]
MDESTFLSQFSPQWTHPDKLEKILVQREDLLAESVAKIRESILTENKHHLLFIGPRGAGKTHLISLIHHRLQTSELTDHVRFAWLNEDEIATTFLKLLLLIYRSLAERYPTIFSRATIPGLSGMEPLAAEEKLGQTLLCELGSCTLVVLMENLDSLFRHMPDGELLRWRAFVQNHPVFATVGTAQTLFDGVSERTEPFFGFFDTQHLEPLSVQDAGLLLEKIATLQGKIDLLEFLQTPTGRARVSAIHDLAGGNPRLYLIFSEFLTKAALNDLVRPFEEMVDRQLTSYYQERLRWLSPQQREIIQLLCHHGRPIPVKQIAEGLFTSHNSITGQLRPLRDMRYVNFRPSGREVLYELAEPLMRLALQVKETHNRKPLALIVDFLRVWHDRVEIEKQLAQCPLGSLGHAYFQEALARMDSDQPNLRHQIWRDQLEGAEDGPCDDETLSKAQVLAEESDESRDWIKVGSIHVAREEWDPAIYSFTHVLEQINISPEDLILTLLRRARANYDAGKLKEAMLDFSIIIQQPEVPVNVLVPTYCFLGLLREEFEEFDEAIAAYKKVISLPGVKGELLGVAHKNLVILYRRVGRFEESMDECAKLIESNQVPPGDIAWAFCVRGMAYGFQGNWQLSINEFNGAIKSPEVDVEVLIEAFTYRGVARAMGNKLREALSDFTAALELFEQTNSGIAKVLNYRAFALRQLGDVEGAIMDYNRVIQLSEAPTEELAQSRYFRAILSMEQRRYEASLDDMSQFYLLADANTLSELTNSDIGSLAERAVSLIFAHTTDPQRWLACIIELLPHFSRFNSLSQLGEALVQHLPKLAESLLNHAAYDAWCDAWNHGCMALRQGEQDYLEIPLRMLGAGIEYLKTKDETKLLILASEERKLLRQALKLPPET